VSTRSLSATIPAELAGQRLDRALAEVFPDFSRARLQQWLKQGRITVDGRTPPGKTRIAGGERVALDVAAEPAAETFAAEDLPLEVVHADEGLIVIDKPAGLVVHPAAGNWSGTLLNALLHHFPELAGVPRAGIVHRLDKDTTGLLVVARNLTAHQRLVADLQARRVHREYLALVQGELVAGGTIDAPIGRHPVDRKRMAVVRGGKPAVTHYRVRERLPGHTLLAVRLETGRTHQIRVHLAHRRHPIVGDPVYGGRLRLPPGASEAARRALAGFSRQALHACRLALRHPLSGEEMAWTSPLPADFRDLLAALAVLAA